MSIKLIQRCEIRLLIIVGWIVCMVGLYYDAHNMVWRGLRGMGLAGHAIGVLFAVPVIGLYVLEWLVVIGAPILFLLSLRRK